MAHFVVDRRDRVAQRLSWAAAGTYETDQPQRFVVVHADNSDEAIRVACGGEVALKSESVQGRDLKEGDVVLSFNDAWGFAAVRKVENLPGIGHIVHLFRPFVHCGDVVTTAGVGVYIGIEEFTISGTSPIALVKRGPELR